MKNIKSAVLLSTFVFLLFSCMEDINLDHLRPEAKLVLNCTAIAGYPVSAYLSRTWFFTDDKPNLHIENAEVRLFVNDRLLETLSVSEDTTNKLGSHFLSGYIPRSGDRLKVVATAPGFSGIEAATELPEKPEASDVSVSHQIDTVRSGLTQFISCKCAFKLTLHDKPSEEDYYLIYLQTAASYELTEEGDTIYRWESRPLDYGNEPLLVNQVSALDRVFGYNSGGYSSGIAFTDELINGKSYTFNMNSIFDVSFMGPGDPSSPGYNEKHTHKYRLYLYAISRSYYSYLKTMQSARESSFSGDLADIGLAEPVRIYSNVAGGTGVLGGVTPQMWEFYVDEE